MLPRISIIEGQKAKFLAFSTEDSINKSLFTNGLWEDHLLDVSKMFYDSVQSPLILDIGANLGVFSIPIAKDIQEKQGNVIAFEPQRIVFYQLCANTFLNRLHNLYAYNKAVSDKPQKLEIPEFDYSRNLNIGAFSLDKDARIFHNIESSAKDETHSVDVITLDNLDVDKAPALIKIDVEGYEIKVLKGALEFLEKYDYPPILFEAWEFDWFAEKKNELLSFVEQLGYENTKLDKTNYVAQHPKNLVKINFEIESNHIKMNRIK